ncbi:MAG: YdcF family protein [Burkholderiales bacterium]|nr:YdcF family protein [Burkholderiales bacterium]
MPELATWKPILTALALPPVPFLLLILIGARLILPRRGLGWFFVLLGAVGIWLSSTQGAARWVQNVVLRPPPALYGDELQRLAQASQAQAKNPRTVILVLGGGRVPRAPEYGMSDLSEGSAERLRYAVWLSRQTGLPLAFTGGHGWGQQQGPSEAEIADRVAREVYGRPLRWLEGDSRDTRGNAALSLRLLQGAGIEEIVLVTHASHMPRALRDFQQAATGSALRFTPAPMGALTPRDLSALDWLPTTDGYQHMRGLLRELLARLVRA